MTPISRFWKLLKPYPKELRQIYAYAVFNGLVNLSLPLGIQAIIGYIQSGEVTVSWIILVGFVLVGYAINGMLQVYQIRIVENIQQDIFTRTSFEYSYRLPLFSPKALGKAYLPEYMNRFFDVLTIQKSLPKILIDFSLSAFQIVFGLLLLVFYSPYFIVLAISLLVVLWLIVRITGPRGLSTSLKESKMKYKQVAWLQNVALGARLFADIPQRDWHLRKSDENTGSYISYREKHFLILLTQFKFFITFKVFIAAGLLLLGGYLVINERMNIGQFVAAEIIIILMINSIEKIIRVIDSIYDVLTALDKVGGVTDLQSVPVGKTPMKERLTSVSLKNVSIESTLRNSAIVEGIQKDLHSGNVYLMNGCETATSAILQAISGERSFLGELRFNGVKYESLLVGDRQRLILGLDFDASPIFSGTIRENITLGEDLTSQEFSLLLSKIQMTDSVIGFQNGIDTNLDINDIEIGREDRQKILWGRLWAKKPELAVLHYPTQYLSDEVYKDFCQQLVDYAKQEKVIVLVVDDERRWTDIGVQHWDISAQ